MEPIIPYLLLNGTASEAINFYAKVLGGTILAKSTFGESPAPCPDGMEDKIMHAVLQAGSLTMMFSDCPPDRASVAGNHISLSMNFTDPESIDSTYKAMSEGATITMELQDTFWGARFGMLTDKFGIHWMFNHDKEQKEK